MTEQEQSRDRAVGALLTLAVSDAIGTTISSSYSSLHRRALLAAGARRIAAHKKVEDIVGSALSLPRRMICTRVGGPAGVPIWTCGFSGLPAMLPDARVRLVTARSPHR